MGNDGKSFELDNFNLNSNEGAWEAPAHDVKNLGNRAIFSSEISGPSTELGQITNLEMPPMMPGESAMPTEPQNLSGQTGNIEQSDINYDNTVLRTTAKLDKRAIKVVDHAIQKFNRDGNAADFYETARKMMEVNLDNSYNRKLEQK